MARLLRGLLEASRKRADVKYRSLRARTTLVEHAEHFLPGVYVRQGRRAWRHWRAPVPGHLARSMSERAPRPDPGWVRSALRATWQLLDPFEPPPVVLRRRASGTATLLVQQRPSEARIFDQIAGEVSRIHLSHAPTSERLERFVAMRRRLSAHVPCPAFEVRYGGRIIAEEFIEGRHVEMLTVDEKHQVVDNSFDRYESLVASEGVGDASGLVSSALEAARPADLPESLAPLRTDGLIGVARDWPLVPSAVDMSAKNVVVRDCELVPIDLPHNRFRWVPFFSDVIEFASRAGCRYFEEIDAAYFDERLRRLFETAGATTDDWTTTFDTAVVTHALVRPLTDQSRDVSSDVYAARAAKYWARVRRLRAALIGDADWTIARDRASSSSGRR